MHRPLWALLWLQWRLLRNNKAVLLIGLLLMVAAVRLRDVPAPAAGRVYVLYWQEDAWVRFLRRQLPEDDSITLAHASGFTNDSGLIVYPAGAHSIQMRPPAEHGGRYKIWYWYSGNDPEVLAPSVRWFWEQTARFGGAGPAHEVAVSTLSPVNPVARQARLQSQKWLSDAHAKPALTLGMLFLCCAYLPSLVLAEQLNERVLDTVTTKPPGMQGFARSVVVFHGGLALLLAAGLALFWELERGSVLITAPAAAAAYLGIGFLIGCWSRHVAGASTAIAIYAALSAGLVALAWCSGGVETTWSLEWQLCRVLQNGTVTPPQTSVLACWAVVTPALAWCALRRRTKR